MAQKFKIHLMSNNDTNTIKLRTKCGGERRKILRYKISKHLLPVVYNRFYDRTPRLDDIENLIISQTIRLTDMLIDEIEGR